MELNISLANKKISVNHMMWCWAPVVWFSNVVYLSLNNHENEDIVGNYYDN
jgi:hypothetical protein